MNAPKSIEVEIQEVNQTEGTIYVINQSGEEAKLNVVYPAKISFAREGRATIKLDENGDVAFVKMASPAPKPRSEGFGRSRFNNSTYGKPQPMASERTSAYHFVSEVKVFTGITLQEFEATYNALREKNWITASNLFPTPIIKPTKPEEAVKICYDAVIFMKVKREGMRESPEDFPDKTF